MSFKAQIISMCMSAGRPGTPRESIADLVDALAHGIALTSVMTPSEEVQMAALDLLFDAIRSTAKDLRKEFLAFQDEPCDDPACPVHGAAAPAVIH